MVLFHPLTPFCFKDFVSDFKIQAYVQDLKHHHYETYAHSLRVGIFSLDLGLKMRQRYLFSDEALRDLCYGGILHDVGKLCIPLEVLTKAGFLDSKERTVINGHPRLGFVYLEHLDSLRVQQIVVMHHEFKREPYPRQGFDRRIQIRLEPERRQLDSETLFLAQIVAVSDLYDALSFRREYKDTFDDSTIESILREQFTGEPYLIDRVLSQQGTS